jgi:hypothetical protein
MVMVVEREDARGALGLLQIFVSYSGFCYVVLSISQMKMIVNTCGS